MGTRHFSWESVPAPLPDSDPWTRGSGGSGSGDPGPTDLPMGTRSDSDLLEVPKTNPVNVGEARRFEILD